MNNQTRAHINPAESYSFFVFIGKQLPPTILELDIKTF